MQSALILLLVSCALAPSGARAGAAPAGMAGAYSLKARGVDAPSWNPATLAWSDDLDIRIVSVRVTAANNSFTLGDYNRWNGGTWTESDKEAILDRIPGSSFEGRADLAAEGPGVARKGWALTTESYVSGLVQVPREFARLVLYGNDPGESFRLEGSCGEGMAWSEFRLSHAREVRGIALGATVKLLQGWGYGGVTQATGSLQTTAEGISGQALLTGRTAEGGTGFGLDLGAATHAPKGWTCGVTLRNALGLIWWSRRPEQRTERAQADSVSIQDLDDEADLVTTVSSTAGIGSFRRSLPVTMTLAAAREWKGMSLEADLREGLIRRAGENTTPRLALGVSRPWRWLEGRAGFALGGADRVMWAAGLGFDPWRIRLDLAAAVAGRLNPFSPNGVGAGVSLGLRWGQE